MEYMKVTLHSDVKERFEKIYPELIESEPAGWYNKQIFLDFLTVIQELDTIQLLVYDRTMDFYFNYHYAPYTKDEPMYRVKNSLAQQDNKYCRFNGKQFLIPEEFIDKIIYDSRIGLGFCTQCGEEYEIETGCFRHLLPNPFPEGRCNPKNFYPYLDKEGKKVFKGWNFYFDNYLIASHIPMDTIDIRKERQFLIKKLERISRTRTNKQTDWYISFLHEVINFDKKTRTD